MSSWKRKALDVLLDVGVYLLLALLVGLVATAMVTL